jgi:hypothetical protein
MRGTRRERSPASRQLLLLLLLLLVMVMVRCAVWYCHYQQNQLQQLLVL